MLKVVLTDEKSGMSLHSEEYQQEDFKARVLLTETLAGHYGVFKTATFTVAGTTELITPKGIKSIQITDLIVTFEKKNAATVSINFHDGTNTAPLFKATLTDAPVNLSSNFRGRIRGWNTAHIDVVIAGADAIGTVAVGYVIHPAATGLTYAEWQAKR